MIHNCTEMNQVTMSVPKLKTNSERPSHTIVAMSQGIRVYRCSPVVPTKRGHIA